MTIEFVVVPREPTPEMCSAFTAVCCECQAATHIIARRMWQAMLAAAPTPPPAGVSAEAPVAWIPKCDFDGMATGRVGRAFGPQPDLLKSRDNCVPVYTHPAPLPTVAGVTEAMVEAFEAKFLECARTRPDSTLRDDIRAALEAALGAREGK